MFNNAYQHSCTSEHDRKRYRNTSSNSISESCNEAVSEYYYQPIYRFITYSYLISPRTHASSSSTWLPINQTRLEKYGAAVLSRIYRNIDFSSTSINRWTKNVWSQINVTIAAVSPKINNLLSVHKWMLR